ncbi:MAG: DegQ family serine endoprotease [Deltaproteobacteria bacterium]|nr:DegQ family serine endoprotease [Deltaproteobacteria bacterium]
MFKSFENFLKNKIFGIKTVGAVAFSCLLGGIVLASGLNWTGLAVAQDPVSKEQSFSSTPSIPSLAPLAEKLTPSVVNIKVVRVEKARFPMNEFQNAPFGDFFERFNNGRIPTIPHDQKVEGSGSGVIISSDGYILTNNHVVEGAKDLKVTLADQREFRAQILGRDPKTDLAVVKIEGGKDFPSAQMGNSDQLKVGDAVMAIGNPFGLNHTVTSGIVSAKGRIIGAGPYDDFIQTDTSINPGNSGGPLINMNGEVVGINTAILPNGQGIGFAIPINTAKPLIPQLVKNGEVTRGFIGVNIQSVTPELAQALNLNGHKGALVADITGGGPAEKAGIKRGDVIVSFNGKEVKDNHELPAMVAGTPVGDEATVVVLRDGKEKEFKLKIAKLPSDETDVNDSEKTDRGKWGMMLRDVTPQVARQYGLKDGDGVLVVGVEPGSPAERASLQQGDIILEVNREPVKSADEAKEKITRASDKKSLLLLVKRGNASIFVALTN